MGKIVGLVFEKKSDKKNKGEDKTPKSDKTKKENK